VLQSLEATLLDALRRHPDIYAVYLDEQEQKRQRPRRADVERFMADLP
jgi:hypothetical protein